MNTRAIQTGANTQTIRQNFIDAEVANAGSHRDFEGIFTVPEGVADAWATGESKEIIDGMVRQAWNGPKDERVMLLREARVTKARLRGLEARFQTLYGMEGDF